MQNMTATDCVPGHHRNDRFGTGTNLTLEIKHVQTMNTGIIFISGIPTNPLVTTRTKRLVSLAGKNNHTYLLILARVSQS